MLQKLSSKKNKFNTGFTFLESLISLSIISIISICIITGILIGNKSFIKNKRTIKKSYTILKFDNCIRDLGNSITIPYWTDNFEISYSGNSISCNWINGNKDIQTVYFSYPVEITKIETVTKKSKAPIGIKINYNFEDSQFETYCTFSAFQYGDIKL